MYKLIHLHTDSKFLHDTLRFESALLKNVIVFIGEPNASIIKKLQGFPFKFYIFDSQDISQIIEKINDSDGVVLNSLDAIKVLILDKIPGDRKVFLRLFGYELYSQKKDKFLSKSSLELLNPISLKKYGIYEYVKRSIKRRLGFEFRVDIKRQKILYSKIDAILLFNKFEYEDLSKYFYMPPFVKLSLETDIGEMWGQSSKNNEIIIGNSRNSWNNHLDVFKELSKSRKINKFKLLLFFNYGPVDLYSRTVRKKENFNSYFIEDFLDKQKFEEIYKTAAALVINSYRQHALGNVFTALLAGAKVYLNKKSSTYKWLKDEGFAVSSIDELAKDIDCNKVTSTHTEYEQNSICFKKLKADYTVAHFLDNVFSILKNE